MKIDPFGKKAYDFIMTPMAMDARINILEGSVRSQKTFCMHPKLLRIVKEMPDGLGVITGVAKDTIYDNVLRDLFEIVGERNFNYNRQTGDLDLMGTDWKVIGAKDEGSEKYIRGKTIAKAYCDELSLMPERFFKQLLNRMSPPGAKLYGTTNPDTPYHYLYKEYISDPVKRASGMVNVIHFTLDDNPSLTKEYKEFIKSAYSGVFYLRFVDGLWVVAEGAIYKDCWNDSVLFTDADCPHDIRMSYVDRYISVDYGTTNPCVFGEYLDDGTTLWKMKEYYWDSVAEGRQKTDGEYAEDMIKFIGEDTNATIIVDPSAASFKAELVKHDLYVKDADNDVEDGIRITSSALKLGMLRVHVDCTKTREEMPAYVWNEKKTIVGVEEPVKQHDHCPDETRYVCKTILKPWRLQLAA